MGMFSPITTCDYPRLLPVAVENLQPLVGFLREDNLVSITRNRIALTSALLVLGLCARLEAQQNGLAPQPPWNGPAGNEPVVPPAPVTGYGDSLPVPWEQGRGFNPPPSVELIGPCCGLCGGGSGCPPLWSFEEGADIFARSRPRNSVLSFDALTQTNVAAGHSFDYPVAPGYEGEIERYLGRDAFNRDWFLEAGFSGFNNWVGTAQVHAFGQVQSGSEVIIDPPGGPVIEGSLFSPFAGLFPGLDGADVHQFRYNASYDSAELNLVIRPRSRPDRLVLYPNGTWHRECQPGLYCSFRVGLRYINWEEQLAMYGSGQVTNLAGATETHNGSWLLNTRNNMYGFQLGTEVVQRSCVWEYGLHFNVSPFINAADMASNVSSHDPFLGDNSSIFSGHNQNVAVDLNLGALASYKLYPNLAVKAKYDIGWLCGVGMASDQANAIAADVRAGELNGVERVNTHGTIFYQGLSLGLEYTR